MTQTETRVPTLCEGKHFIESLKGARKIGKVIKTIGVAILHSFSNLNLEYKVELLFTSKPTLIEQSINSLIFQLLMQ